MNSGSPSRLRALLAALSLLVLGAVSGIALDRHLHRGGGHASAAAALHEMTISSLAQRLDLSAEQRRRIDSIITARHSTLHHAWQSMHTQLGAALDSVHLEIEAVLAPEQRAQFRAWLVE